MRPRNELLVSAVVGLFAALIGSGVIVAGWSVVHRRELDRDRAAKRQDLRVQYLIEAYRRLEYVSNRAVSRTMAPDFERAVADIQLFGTTRQVELAQALAVGLAERGAESLDPLLEELRRDLREEVGLGRVSEKLRHLRFSFPELSLSPASPSTIVRDGAKSG